MPVQPAYAVPERCLRARPLIFGVKTFDCLLPRTARARRVRPFRQTRRAMGFGWARMPGGPSLKCLQRNASLETGPPADSEQASLVYSPESGLLLDSQDPGCLRDGAACGARIWCWRGAASAATLGRSAQTAACLAAYSFFHTRFAPSSA